MTTLADLRRSGYFLLPLPPRSKEPPPAGWVNRTEPYEVPAEGNVAIGTRGELAILITNDERATAWATREYGDPNVRSRRGGHWYFRARPGQANEANAETLVGTMELHVRNKYALIPPSIHPSGVPYGWVRPLPRLADLPECPDLRDLWHPRGTHHAQLLRMSTAKARDGADEKVIGAELRAYRDAHLPDPGAHPDRVLDDMARSASAKFGRPGAGPLVSPPLEEFDPETGEVFLAADADGRPEIGIAWVTEGRIHRTTLSSELKRIAREYDEAVKRDPKGSKEAGRDRERKEKRLLESLPFTGARDALWQLPDDPTLESVAQFETRTRTSLNSALETYYRERVVAVDPDIYSLVACWTLAASARTPEIDFAPRLMFEAPFGWGKSTAAEAVYLIVPRTIYGAALTPAAVYRVMNRWHPVLVVDESAVVGNDDFLRVLRAGFKRGAKIIRALQNQDEGVVALDPFGFLILTTQIDTRDDLVSRCYVAHLKPGEPTKRVSGRDPEARALRTVLARLRLEILTGTAFPNVGTTAELARAEDGLEPRSRDKLTALWPFAVRYGVEGRVAGAASRLEADSTEQLASSDKGLVVAAISEVVREAGGLSTVKAQDLVLSNVHKHVERLLIEQGEGTEVPVGGGETVPRLDQKRYGPREFTAPLIRDLGFKTKTANNRTRLDRDSFVLLWPRVWSRYGGNTTLDELAERQVKHPTTPPSSRSQAPVSPSENAGLTHPTTTPPPHHQHPTTAPLGVVGSGGQDGGVENGRSSSGSGGVVGSWWGKERGPLLAPASADSEGAKPLDPERDRRIAEGVSVLKRELVGNSAGYDEQTLRDRLASQRFTTAEIDSALGRLYGEGGVVRDGDFVRLKGAGP